MAINRDKILKGAEKLVQKGKVEAAIREYEKLLKLNPEDVNTINRIGDLYNRVGQVEKAVELYERIADSFAADGFTNKAIAIYKKINRLAPDRVQVFERLADLYSQQGLAVEARDQFTVLVDWYLKNEDLDRAVTIQRKLLQSDPENHLAHLKLADLLIRKGDAPEAIGAYERLGTMLLDSGKLDEAERLYRHAIEQNPPSGEFLLPAAEALIDAGKVPVAREFLAEAQKRSPDSAAISLLNLKVALASGETSAALERARKLLELDSDDLDVRFHAGRAFLGAGESGRGRELLLAVARTRMDQGDRTGADEAFQTLMKSFPQDEEVLKLGTQVLSPTENGEMLFTLRAALADRYFQDDREAEARRLYSDLIREDPDNRLFRERLHQLGVGPAPEQSPEAEPAVEPEVGGTVEESIVEPIIPEPQVPPVQPVAAPGAAEGPGFNPSERLAEANVFAKYGLLDKALHHLDTILKAFPDHLEARERLVVLSAEAGRSQEVADQARSLVEVYTERGDQEGLERVSGLFPDLAVSAAPEEPEAPAEMVEIEIVEEDFEPEVAEVPEFPEVPEAPETPEVPEIPEDEAFPPEPGPEEIVEPLELEEVDPDSFEPREIEPVRDGLDFEVVEPPKQEEDAVGAPGPSGPSGGAMDWIEDLEQAVKQGGRAPVEKVLPETETETETETDAAEGAGLQLEKVSEPEPEFEPPGGPPKSDLNQMDSFLENSLYEDATRLLRRLEAEHPESRALAERRLTLKEKGFVMGEPTQVEEDASDLFVDEEEAYVDLAAELEEEMAAEDAIVEKAAGPGEGEVSLEDVFREFQKGVSEQLSEEDADTHFNLGIAYKEMGLLAEAIREFQVAAKDSSFLIECCSMIGACYIDQGLWDQAAEWYQRALDTPNLETSTLLALQYELAGCLEGSGDVDAAMRSFEAISEADPSFRDVSSRLSHLASQRQAN